MPGAPKPRSRLLTVVAQDPSVRDPRGPRHRRILRARVEVPAEELQQGPGGYRVQVVDYDVSNDVYYKPCALDESGDAYEKKGDRTLLADPGFHCQNVYALVMRTLARFEFALGRRVSWGFYGHHLNVVPHAFADANAFYSPEDHALLFGYFPDRQGKMVYTCLSHDIVVHEATHALLDGLRVRFTEPSSPDQAAFHEGFADIVALLSVFALPDVAKVVIDLASAGKGRRRRRSEVIRKKDLTREALRRSGLLGLAEQFGSELSVVRGSALRRSVDELWPPSPRYYRDDPEFEESHRRGEILVAAVMSAFLDAWHDRLAALDPSGSGIMSRDRVVEDGAEIADTFLTMVIRALDYTPPVHVEFGDFLSAALTSDAEVRPDDSRYGLRRRLLERFRDYGIEPASAGDGAGNVGFWRPPPAGVEYGRTHFEQMRSEPDEVFRFAWENRDELELSKEAYSRVISVRPSVRVGPDGFVLREVVAELIQTLAVKARELHRYGIRRPAGMPGEVDVTLQGGGTMVFDEYGLLKYYIHNDVVSPTRQPTRLEYLWEHGYFRRGSAAFRRFSNLHRQRAAGQQVLSPEVW